MLWVLYCMLMLVQSAYGTHRMHCLQAIVAWPLWLVGLTYNGGFQSLLDVCSSIPEEEEEEEDSMIDGMPTV